MAPNATGYYWNDERVEQLKGLWADGLSYSQIARKLGGGVTRNAVIGQVSRLNLAGRTQSARTVRPRIANVAPVSRRAPEPQLPVIELPPVVLGSGEHVTVMTVRDCHCRSPIGDPGDEAFHFCGQTPRRGSPYCEAHARKAYQPQQANKGASAKAFRDSGMARTGLG